jgi:ribosome maturation factor RimP
MERLENIRSIADRVARSRGLEVFDLQFRRESVGWVLRIVLDRPYHDEAQISESPSVEEGVTIDECQRVSGEVSALLDVEDPIDVAYTLEVSSPGLDRPLRHADDYRRFAGRLAKLVLSEEVDGRRHITGRLRGMDGDAVRLADAEGRMHLIPLSLVTRARLEVEF